MRLMVFGLYLLGGLLVVVGLLYLARRYLDRRDAAARQWVDRSGSERRQREVAVDFDRRVSPRRQDDIARAASKYLGDKG